MKVKINIELIDEHNNSNYYEEHGLSKKSIEGLYYIAVENLVKEVVENDLNYTIKVEVGD